MECKQKQGEACENHASIECRVYRPMFRTRDFGIAINNCLNLGLEHSRPLRGQQEIQLRLAVPLGRWRSFSWSWSWRLRSGQWMGRGNCGLGEKWSQVRRRGSWLSRLGAMSSD